MARKPELGFVQLKKTAGVAGAAFLTTGTQVNIPVIGVAPYNPLNRIRPALMNASSYLSVVLQGKKSPGVTMRAIMKASFHTHTLINSLVLSWDGNNNSDEFAINVSDGTAARQFVLARCSRVAIAGSGSGAGGILMDFDFLATQGETDVASPATFAGMTTDAGSGLGIDNVDFGSSPTATNVRAYSMSLLREQIADYFCDKTLFANRIESKRFMGSFTLQQDPDGATIPSTAVTMRFGAGTGIIYSANIDKDAETYPLDPNLIGTITREYTFFNASGGSNISVSTY